MIVTIDGLKKKHKITAEEVEYCANWFAEKLMHGNLVKNLTINFSFIDQYAYKGMAEHYEDENHRRPRTFNINIRANMKRADILKTIAHEMVHVKQYAKGELSMYVFGKHHRWLDGEVPTSTSYWDHPWEIEAYGREIGLYERYKNHIHTNKMKFKNA